MPFLSSWHALAQSAKDEDARGLLLSQRTLATAHEQLRKYRHEDAHTEGDTLEAIAATIETCSKRIDEITRRMLKAVFFNEVHPQSVASGTATAAEQAFGIAELVERILESADIKDVLSVQQVNRKMADIIARSIKLQHHVHLLPDHDGPFRILQNPPKVRRKGNVIDLSFPRVQIREEFNSSVTPQRLGRSAAHPGHDSAKADDNSVVIVADIRPGRKAHPFTLGDRYRSMLICQPPLRRVTLCVMCCRSRPSTYSTISCPSGVTLGYLYDACVKLAAQHRLCPNATLHMHDAQGFVVTTVECIAKVDLRTDNPTLIKRREMLAGGENLSRIANSRFKPDNYIEAKRAAHANGQPIPTLADFEAATGGNGVGSSSQAEEDAT